MNENHIVLITNLSGVVINDVHLNAHALLIEPAGDDRLATARVRGFLTTGTTPLFTLKLKGFEHSLDTGGRDEVIRFGTGEIVQLYRHNPGMLLGIERFEPDESNQVYVSIWAALEAKVIKSWPRHQWMPSIKWGMI
jgi:hypothetical protein